MFIPPALAPLAPGGLALAPDGARLYVAGTGEDLRRIDAGQVDARGLRLRGERREAQAQRGEQGFHRLGSSGDGFGASLGVGD